MCIINLHVFQYLCPSFPLLLRHALSFLLVCWTLACFSDLLFQTAFWDFPVHLPSLLNRITLLFPHGHCLSYCLFNPWTCPFSGPFSTWVSLYIAETWFFLCCNILFIYTTLIKSVLYESQERSFWVILTDQYICKKKKEFLANYTIIYFQELYCQASHIK